MRICIPIQHDRGIESLAYSHFGSASYFIIYDTDTGETKTIQNTDQHHEHGSCHPLKALAEETINAIIVGGIGSRAIAILNDMGIKVYRSSPGTVKENIDLFKKNELPELTPANACSHHDHGCKS
jgi:predicted Fe-Mo cluster-binding NifX family protein